MSVFDRRAKVIQRDAMANLENFEEFNYLREYTSKILLDRLQDITNKTFPTVLDLGSNYGPLVPHLLKKPGTSTVYQMEHSFNTLSKYSQKYHQLAKENNINFQQICASEEHLPFKEKSLDLVISCLSLHWVNDLPGTFSQVRKCLKDDGVFIGVLFGEDTLQELRSSFVLAEKEIVGGVGHHISPFTSISDVGNLLNGAGFTLTTIDQELMTVNYADAFILMYDLRRMAENNVSVLPRRFVSKETFCAVASIYQGG
eukprot:TRINITY_DN11096_c0_g1_i2.p1 TRINITY_DN11096_c0_g1~~TRINITY_DN11096_c0_g1_i2.p1  ORF type:complete len:291 (+),score=58.52 TRINITY_DN11096_c0_g1_i2:104-874(+)